MRRGMMDSFIERDRKIFEDVSTGSSLREAGDKYGLTRGTIWVICKKHRTGKNYAGRQASYGAIHQWLKKRFGSPSRCVHCGSKGGATRYEYALLAGMKYERKRENFIELCAACHKSYDGIIAKLAVRKYKAVVASGSGVEIHFGSVIDASNKLQISRTSISNCLTGRSRTAGGYRWNYA